MLEHSHGYYALEAPVELNSNEMTFRMVYGKDEHVSSVSEIMFRSRIRFMNNTDVFSVVREDSRFFICFEEKGVCWAYNLMSGLH